MGPGYYSLLSRFDLCSPRFVTKLVPSLTEVEQCTEVPQEVCTTARGRGRKVKHPVLKKWCYQAGIQQETSTTQPSGPSYGRNLTF